MSSARKTLFASRHLHRRALIQGLFAHPQHSTSVDDLAWRGVGIVVGKAETDRTRATSIKLTLCTQRLFTKLSTLNDLIIAAYLERELVYSNRTRTAITGRLAGAVGDGGGSVGSVGRLWSLLWAAMLTRVSC